ncbi:relaxase/mobilization nuclease domain-containing protein [Eubacteriales bacterium OttesenSCG-928-M02]|nr:relaxase/mobilization nuclease domain-containing protein [Eubacteriales bacterium OttesenSCG-928-M02]
MGTTAIWDVKGWLGKVVIYVENPDKTGNPAFYEKQDMTERDAQGLADIIDYATQDTKVQSENGTITMQQYVTGINCLQSTARDEMMAVKKRFGKTDGIVAFHGYQSFAPGEATPDVAHDIGIRLASELWGDRFQVIVATHLDKQNHLHNHFVINSVSFADGYRYNDCTATYMDMRKTSDRLCREYGLSVIDNPRHGKAKQYGEWKADQQGKPTWRGLIKKDIDRAIREAMTDKQFFHILRSMGYEIKIGKDISVRPPGKERFVRLARNFGEEYTMERICHRILQDWDRPPIHPPKKKTVIVARFKGDLKKTARIGGLRGLYLHYCYKLGILPKGRASPAKLHFLLREDIRKLDTITKEARLLSRNRIDTVEQLSSYKESLSADIDTLTADRKRLRNKTRNVGSPEQLVAMKSEIAALTKKLSELRKEVKLCDGIATRSKKMSAKLKTIRQDEVKEKEEQSHEHRRRSGRSNR